MRIDCVSALNATALKIQTRSTCAPFFFMYS
jgi:hypothetical protein